MDMRSIFMGLAFSMMWSSAFATARIIVQYAPPISALSLRFLISGLLAIFLARALGQSWRLSRGQLKSVIIFGLCQNALYLGLNFEALQWIEASLASIIASSMPLIVAFLGWLMHREKVGLLGAFGLIAGFVGVTLIMGSRVSVGADPVGILFCVVGAVALSVATLTLRSASSGGNLLMIVGLQMLVGSVALGAVAAVKEPFVFQWNTTLTLAFVYQILIPGLTATVLWVSLVARIGTVNA
jgi:probable blue pigment (indigoidine) exporter